MADFLSKLKEKKFFNIVDKQEDTIPGRAVPPIPSQPATVSDQGQVPVCTSHAVGKGVVDILNGANLDCDQVHTLNCLYAYSIYFLLKIIDIYMYLTEQSYRELGGSCSAKEDPSSGNRPA